MLCARRFAVALVVALLMALAAGPAAGATPTSESVTVKILGDYSLDHIINGSWSPSELQAAIAEARRAGAGYEDFEQAVQEVYDREFLGIQTGNGDGQTAQPADPGSTLLPEPRGPGERDQPPWPFLAMTALAVALAISGAGSSIYRRVHR